MRRLIFGALGVGSAIVAAGSFGACASLLGYDDLVARQDAADVGSDAHEAGKTDAPMATDAPPEAIVDAVPDVPVTDLLYPQRPAGAVMPSGKGKTYWFEVRRFYFGTQDATGSKIKGAYQDWGWDLDARCTDLNASTNSLDTCMRMTGSAVDELVDGNLCRDNNFGARLAAPLDVISIGYESALADAIGAGGRTWLLRLDDVDDGPDDAFVTGALYVTTKTTSGSAPKFDGTDVRDVGSDSLADAGATAPAAVRFDRGFIAGNRFVSGDSRYDATILLPWNDDPIALPVAGLTLTLPLSADRTSTTAAGTVSGGIPLTSLLGALPRFASVGMVCAGDRAYDGLATSLAVAADVYVSGTEPDLQNTAKTCDGVSLGIGFDAVRSAAYGTESVTTPQPAPCGDGG
jgi:hypothetical protein